MATRSARSLMQWSQLLDIIPSLLKLRRTVDLKDGATVDLGELRLETSVLDGADPIAAAGALEGTAHHVRVKEMTSKKARATHSERSEERRSGGLPARPETTSRAATAIEGRSLALRHRIRGALRRRRALMSAGQQTDGCATSPSRDLIWRHWPRDLRWPEPRQSGATTNGGNR